MGDYADAAVTYVATALGADADRAVSISRVVLEYMEDGPNTVASWVNTLKQIAIGKKINLNGVEIRPLYVLKVSANPFFRAIAEHGFNGWTMTDKLVFINRTIDIHDAWLTLVHEAIHVKQFRATGRPKSYRQMLEYEIQAYGESYDRTGDSGFIENGFLARELYGKNLSEDLTKDAMIRLNFLPEHGSIDDLYVQ